MKTKRKFFFRFLILTFIILYLWTQAAERNAHFTPDYPKTDLMEITKKSSLSEEDYQIIFQQTGLGKSGVDRLIEAENLQLLPVLQERFFDSPGYYCTRHHFICHSEKIPNCGYTARELFPTVQDGDILITFSSHVFGWRNGHAALVIDSQNGLTLEAITLGCASKICNITHWQEYPCYALLRLKNATGDAESQVAELSTDDTASQVAEFATDDTASQIAEFATDDTASQVAKFATDKLQNLPYDLFSFLHKDKLSAGTQCAQLIWTAYKQFGYDLDSDGGILVTPDDIYHSELLEIVQIYGLDPRSNRPEKLPAHFTLFIRNSQGIHRLF